MTWPQRAVVLAGGRGTRLGDAGAGVPKALVTVGDGTRLVDLVVAQLRAAGVERITFALCHEADAIMEALGDGDGRGVAFDFYVERTPLGTAGAIGAIADLDGTFYVANCDVVTDLDLRDVAAAHAASGASLTVASRRQVRQCPFGVLEIEDPADDASPRLRSISEKPTTTELLNMGMYVADPAVREVIEPGVRIDMDDVVTRLIDGGRDVRAHVFDGRWIDVGTPPQLRRVANDDGAEEVERCACS